MARETAEELVRSLLDLYGGGLARMMEMVYDSPAGGELFDRFAADDLVASLLLLHDLHPEDTETRILRALDGVRPYLGSHGGDVTLLGIADDVVPAAPGRELPRLPVLLDHHEAGDRKGDRRGGAGGGADRGRRGGGAGATSLAAASGASAAGGGNSLVQIGLQCPSEIEALRS